MKKTFDILLGKVEDIYKYQQIGQFSKFLLNFNLYLDKINNIVNVEEVEFKRLNTCIKKRKAVF